MSGPSFVTNHLDYSIIRSESELDDTIDFNLALIGELAVDILILVIGKAFNSLMCTDEYERGRMDAIDEMPLIDTLKRLFDKKIYPYMKYEDIAAVVIFFIGCVSGYFFTGVAITSLVVIYRIIAYNT